MAKPVGGDDANGAAPDGNTRPGRRGATAEPPEAYASSDVITCLIRV